MLHKDKSTSTTGDDGPDDTVAAMAHLWNEAGASGAAECGYVSETKPLTVMAIE